MRLKYNFVITDVCDDKIAVPVGESASAYHGVLSLNETGAAILELLIQGNDEETIIKKLQQQFDEDPQLPEFVHTFLEKLIEGGILA